MEIWKKIKNFSRYEASNLGRLRSLNYKNSKRTQVLKPAKSNDGYLKTVLQADNGKSYSWTVQKWVTLAFYGEREVGQEIDHINSNKEDNNIINLEYVSRSENIKRAYKNKLIIPKRGSLNGMAKITEDIVNEIRNYAILCKSLGIRYYGRNEVAKAYNISSSYVKEIVNGRNTRRSCWT